MGLGTCSVTFLFRSCIFPVTCQESPFASLKWEGTRAGSQWSLLALAFLSSQAVLCFPRSHDVSWQQRSGEALSVRVLWPILHRGLWVGAARAEAWHVSCFVFPCQTAKGVGRFLYIALHPIPKSYNKCKDIYCLFFIYEDQIRLWIQL